MLASAFAMALQCEKHGTDPCMECDSCKRALSKNHPDIITITHEKPNSIGIEDIRIQLIDDVSIKPYTGPYKIYILNEAEKLTLQAQNALLKTIEEPPAYAVILLLTSNADSLLPTISSRCVTLNLRPVKESDVKEYLMEHMHLPDYQAQIDARAALDDSIAQNEAALKTAGEPYYPDGLETRQMDDIITGLALKNGLFPQSLTLTEAVPGAVSAYLAVQEQADGSAAPAEAADQTGEASDAPQTGGGVYIGTATLSAQGDVSQWLHFLDEVERSCKGLRVTNFSISDYDYVENNTQAVSTSLITGTLEIYLCGSGREADA